MGLPKKEVEAKLSFIQVLKLHSSQSVHKSLVGCYMPRDRVVLAQLEINKEKIMSSEKNERRNMSKHILPTSGNLLGLCFAILSFIKVSGLGNETIIDEFIVVAIVLFLSSSIVSYVSMRSSCKEEYYERIAEFIFLGGLSLLGICAVAVGFALLD